MSTPLTGWPTNILDILHARVRNTASHPSIYYFKIGRTNDIDVRLGGYRQEYNPPPTRLVAIYETSSVDHALIVEAALIEAHIEHPKCLNNANHAGGNVSPDYYQYVYLALWDRPR